MAEVIALVGLPKSLPAEEVKTETKTNEASDPPANHGKLIADATCAPAALYLW